MNTTEDLWIVFDISCLCRMTILTICLQVKVFLSYCPIHVNSISYLGKGYIYTHQMKWFGWVNLCPMKMGIIYNSTDIPRNLTKVDIQFDSASRFFKFLCLYLLLENIVFIWKWSYELITCQEKNVSESFQRD